MKDKSLKKKHGVRMPIRRVSNRHLALQYIKLTCKLV